MSLSFEFKLRKIAKQVRLKDELTNNQQDWIVWFYTLVEKNIKAASQPLVKVAFRKVEAENLLGDIFYKFIPITSLGQLRIGTVWKDSICRSEIIFEEQEFDVDFTEGAWRHKSFSQAIQLQEPPPYPMDNYKLHYPRDKNWFIDFNVIDSSKDGKLLIPCLEFFYRCYGRAAEVKRVLTTYPWEGSSDSVMSRFYAPLNEPEEDGTWKVNLKMRLVKGDAILLAHAKYENYTKLVLKSIYSQIESCFNPKNPTPSFLKIQPWHEGLAKLKVRGIRMSKSSFLGLQIIGCSEPDGVLIQRGRENQGTHTSYEEDANFEEGGTGTAVRKFRRLPDIIDFTGAEEPDHSTGGADILDSDFKVLGKRRSVHDVRQHGRNRIGGPRGGHVDIAVAEPPKFSSGDAYGSGKDVGYANIHSREVVDLDSKGMVRDMWNAMLYIQKEYSNIIKKVEWFTYASDFCSNVEYALIGLNPFKDDDKTIRPAIHNWVYYNIKEKIPRGLLVARLTTTEKIVFIVEIQRKVRTKQAEDGYLDEVEESFQGLVFSLDDFQNLHEYLSYVLMNIRHETGVFHALTGACPGFATTFSHRQAEAAVVQCDTMVINALRKMNICLE